MHAIVAHDSFDAEAKLGVALNPAAALHCVSAGAVQEWVGRHT